MVDSLCAAAPVLGLPTPPSPGQLRSLKTNFVCVNLEFKTGGYCSFWERPCEGTPGAPSLQLEGGRVKKITIRPSTEWVKFRTVVVYSGPFLYLFFSSIPASWPASMGVPTHHLAPPPLFAFVIGRERRKKKRVQKTKAKDINPSV
jgi:hypothetical protein